MNSWRWRPSPRPIMNQQGFWGAHLAHQFHQFYQHQHSFWSTWHGIHLSQESSWYVDLLQTPSRSPYLLRSPGEVVASLLHSMQVAFRNTMHKINRCATRTTNQPMENIIKSISKVYHTDIMIWQWPTWITYNNILGEKINWQTWQCFSTFSLTKPPLGRHDGCHFYQLHLVATSAQAPTRRWESSKGCGRNPMNPRNDIVISPIWIDRTLLEIFLGAFRGNQNEFAHVCTNWNGRSHGVCKENKWYSEFIIDICRSFCKHGDGAFPHFAGVIKNYRPKQCTINNGKSRQKFHISAVFDRLPHNG